MDKLANMQAFDAVGRTGSFAEAARQLNLANSVVSKRIKDLESHLGVQLLIRTTRKVTLTDTGYAYLEQVRRILDDLEEVEALVQERRDEATGTIRLAAPLSFGMQFLGPALSEYLRQHPNVVVKTYLSDRRISLVDEGYDLSIRTGPLEDSSLVAKKLLDCRRVFCASPTYLAQKGRPKTPRDLKHHNCLSYLNLADGKAWPYQENGKRKWQTVSGNFLSDNGDLLHEAAVSACGLALLPTFIVGDSINDKRLETVLEDYEESDFNIYAVYQHTRHLSVKVRTLIDHLYHFLNDKSQKTRLMSAVP
jgi:DNA-binding transcriptional LysR family regulator